MTRAPLDLTADLHTHSDLTDGADSPEAMALAAAGAGLTTWALTDHVRRSSDWVEDYVRRVRAIRVPGLQVQCGVEAKVLDGAGTLDLPARLPALDLVLVADHQFPGTDGPVHPRDVADGLSRGRRHPAEVVDELVEATARAVLAAPAPPVVAHLFSLLPKVGLSEELVTDAHLDVLAAACRRADARVEVNEKWRCPSVATAVALLSRGVGLTLGSDAHRTADVGAGEFVRSVAAVLAAGGIAVAEVRS